MTWVLLGVHIPLFCLAPYNGANAKVAELADALVLGASGETRESSSLSFRTTFLGEGALGVGFHRH
jgi:hypothetical protein